MADNLLKFIVVFVAILFSVNVALAQTPNITGSEVAATQAVKLPDPLTPETVRELISTLSDQQVRSLLLERLDAVAKLREEQSSGDQVGVTQLLQSWVGLVGTSVYTAVVRAPRILDGFVTSRANFFNKHEFSGLVKLILIMLGAIAAGLMAEKLVNRLTASRRENIQVIDDSLSLSSTLKIMGLRLFWDMIALIVFFIVTRSIGLIFVPAQLLPLVELFMVNMVVIPRLAWAFSRFLNAPNQPALRLINISDEVAAFYHKNVIGLALLVGFNSYILQFQELNGVEMGETRLGFWLSGLIFVWLVIACYVTRDSITQILLGSRPEEVTPNETRVAQVFPWFIIGFVVFMWCVVQIIAGMGRFDLLGGRQYVILTIVTFTPALDTMIRGLVRHLVQPMQGTGYIAQQAYHSTKRSYIRIGRVVLFALVILFIAGLWDLDFENMATAGVGARFAGGLLEVLIVLAIGYLIWEVITLLINRKLAAEMTAAGFDLDSDEPGGGEGGGAGGSRLSTVLPMIRFSLQIGIVSMTVLIALSNMGIDVTPLLAGAGVLGIAIGFGAQSLVKDVVSGVFFLVEDAFRVGEYLQINDTVGTVEKISLRSLQLRHHNGPIHTIPFGEIPKVTNSSRDWMIMKLKWTLPFGTDINKIKKLFKEIGKEMMQADYADNIIQTFKSQGVYDVDDVGIVMRGKFMAKPGTQWLIRKDVFARVQKKLEDNGIEFARREVRVNVPGLQEAGSLDQESKNAISAGAAQAVQSADNPATKTQAPDTP